jgi:FeS assembly SUF system regulator
MIRLGKLTDYAVVVMVQLSKEGQGSAPVLAEKTGLPEPTVAKVLKKLSKQKLVEAMRGAHGGYRLARPARAVTVADIVTAMEGPIAIASCVPQSETACKSETSCPARGGWNSVNRAIRQALESVTIVDMGAPQLMQIKSNARHA